MSQLWRMENNTQKMVKDLNVLKVKNKFPGGNQIFTCFIFLGIILPVLGLSQNHELPIRKTLYFNDEEREYYIHTPLPEPAEKYWLLIVVHGGGGNGRNYFLIDGLRNEIKKQGLKAMIVAPSFSNKDVMSSRFPAVGEGKFLKTIIAELNETFLLHPKILLTGYSRGGQFSHRFALQNPEMLQACAPFAAGTWSTPEGTLLVEGIGEILDPVSFLSSTENKDNVPKRLQNMFDPRVVQVAGNKAASGAIKVPFLVMCGNMDTRFEIAKQFASELDRAGYEVKTNWTNNPHKEREKYFKEFSKYSKEAIKFFKTNTKELRY